MVKITDGRIALLSLIAVFAFVVFSCTSVEVTNKTADSATITGFGWSVAEAKKEAGYEAARQFGRYVETAKAKCEKDYSYDDVMGEGSTKYRCTIYVKKAR
ncbi:MAG: hypothetical protein MUD12_06695 [Spirochaetes bacterium]|nr:hypothetical protein [Spirochaetota bacterium]